METVFVSFAAHVDNEVYLGRALERLGDAALKEQEPDIGAAFLKFAVVTKELSALMKTLVRAGHDEVCDMKVFGGISRSIFMERLSESLDDNRFGTPVSLRPSVYLEA